MTVRMIPLILLLSTHVRASLPDGVYEVPLDGEARHKLFWALDYKNSMVKFEIHAQVEDNEWFAIGFSDRGELEFGEYCVYQPNDAESPSLLAVWTDDKCIANFFPEEEGLCGSFNHVKGEILKFTFTRPFQKCTAHHYQIEDGTTHIVWSRGHGEVIGRSLCRRREQGMNRVQILKTEGIGAPHPPSTWSYTATVKDLRVPSGDTTYWCHTVKLPPQLKKKHHIIQAESHLTPGNEGLVHHMELFHCEIGKDDRIPFYSGPCDQKPAELKVCSKVITAWAMGAKPFIYPKEAGLPIGGPDYTFYAMLEMHYNNPAQLSDWVDSSGFKIYLTPDLRPNDAGVIELGLEYVDKMAIPPKQEIFTLSGYCISECTSIALPEDGIHVFGSQLHTHLTGVMLETRHIRDGVELDRLNFDYHYSPHLQEIRLLKKAVNVRPGDALIHTCFYNTMDRDNVTLGGFATTDEMCVNYIYYYPKVDLEVCKSSISDDYLASYFESLRRLEGQETGGDMAISDAYKAIEWNNLRVQVLSRLYEESPIFMQCNNSAGGRFPGDWSHMPVPVVRVPRPRDSNACIDDVEEIFQKQNDDKVLGIGRNPSKTRDKNGNEKEQRQGQFMFLTDSHQHHAEKSPHTNLIHNTDHSKSPLKRRNSYPRLNTFRNQNTNKRFDYFNGHVPT